MRNKKIYAAVVTAVLTALLLPAGVAKAQTEGAVEPRATNAQTGYEVKIEDRADLLTDEEEELLVQTMMPLTDTANVGFLTVDSNLSSAYHCLSQWSRENFGDSSVSAVNMIIDMDNRQIYIHNTGAISYEITNNDAEVITANIFKYASDENYYECARLGFEQLYITGGGGKVSSSAVAYISNALLAIILALIICYFAAKATSASRKTTDKEKLAVMPHKIDITGEELVHTGTTKRYTPVSSGGGGGGGSRSSGGGGGGGGGGGHSSGGGHGF